MVSSLHNFQLALLRIHLASLFSSLALLVVSSIIQGKWSLPWVSGFGAHSNSIKISGEAIDRSIHDSVFVCSFHELL